MSFTFRKAVREKVSLLIALAGPTGCGKTFSALELATGLVAGTGKRIYAIDTEADRMLHYADRFDFEHGNLKPPFRPDAYREAIVAADEQHDCGAIVIDSGSHEYEGEGGIQDWAAELEHGEPKPGIADPEPWKKEHWIVQPVKSPGNWKEPKTAHKRMMGRLLQCRAHLIFCLRAEEKMLVTQEVDAKGYKKTVIVPAADRPLLERWAPLCEKRFMYEMTASFLLLSDRPGVPIPIKLQDQHRGAFPDGERVSRKSGEALAAWANGGAAPRRDAGAETLAQAEAAANKGSEAFTAFWKDLPRTARAIVKPRMDEFKAMALAADQPDDDDDPFAGGTRETTKPAAAEKPNGSSSPFWSADSYGVPAHPLEDGSGTDWMRWNGEMIRLAKEAPDRSKLDLLEADNRIALENFDEANPKAAAILRDQIVTRRDGFAQASLGLGEQQAGGGVTP